MFVILFCLAMPEVVEIPAPTYASVVAPLLNKHCVICHRSGEVAPFPLTSYEDARKRAGFLAKMAEEKRMPPWKAEPGFGEFHDTRILTGEEIVTLKAWADAGAPLGDPARVPPLPVFTEGWQLGKPDLVLEMPGYFDIPADGPDIYRSFVMPTRLKTDQTVAAIEFKPGNHRTVHHAMLFLDSSGEARRKDAADPAHGFGTFGGPGFLPSGTLGGWAPGNKPRRLPEGMGRLLKKDSDIVIQVHYHPTGKMEKDRSKVAIYFTPEPAVQMVAMMPLATRKIDIPPGEKRYNRHVEFTTPEHLRVVTVTPHMHLLGQEMKVRAITPQGKEIPLIWIRHWEFNWQDSYSLVRPLDIPAGSKLVLDAWYDNSAGNPLNPSSPPQRVTWGEQTVDEMCLCFISIVADSPQQLQKVRSAVFLQLFSPKDFLRLMQGK